MTDHPTPPRTKAGREMMQSFPFDEWHPVNRGIVLDMILAIEAEAAALPAQEPLDVEDVRDLIVRAYQRGFSNGRYTNAPPDPMKAMNDLLPRGQEHPDD